MRGPKLSLSKPIDWIYTYELQTAARIDGAIILSIQILNIAEFLKNRRI